MHIKISIQEKFQRNEMCDRMRNWIKQIANAKGMNNGIMVAYLRVWTHWTYTNAGSDTFRQSAGGDFADSLYELYELTA